MWSKVKQSLRSAEARTRENLVEAIAAALQTVTPKDARGWFASCGYSIILGLMLLREGFGGGAKGEVGKV